MKKSSFYLFLLIFLAACEGPEGPTGPAGQNGTSGANGTNGTNGANGLNSLIALSDGSAHCAGGIKITSGLDKNSDGVLNESEIANTEYVCGGSGGSGPKELKFPLGTFSATHDPAFYTLYEGFDIKNFEAYDSIVLVLKDVEVKPEGQSSTVDNENLIFEVVDVTNNNQLIAGSHFTAKTGDQFVSPNFAGSLPTGAFDLGFSVKSENAGFNGFYKPILVLIDND